MNIIRIALLLLFASQALAVEHRRTESKHEKAPHVAVEHQRHVEAPKPATPPPLCVRHPKRCSLPALLDMGGGRGDPSGDGNDAVGGD